MMDESDLTMEEYIEVQAKKSRRRGKVGLQEWIRRISISGRGQAPEKVTATDLFYMRSMDRGTDNVSYLLAHNLFRHAEGKKSKAKISGGHFIGIDGIAPHPPHTAAQTRTRPKRTASLEEEVHGIRESLAEQREVMDAIARDFLGLPYGQLVVYRSG
nr:hypothetical protein [Tanacetum cinerariifolium]